MIKNLLIPLFFFAILKLSLTLAVTYKSLTLLPIAFLMTLILLNLYILIRLIQGKVILPKSFKLKR